MRKLLAALIGSFTGTGFSVHVHHVRFPLRYVFHTTPRIFKEIIHAEVTPAQYSQNNSNEIIMTEQMT